MSCPWLHSRSVAEMVSQVSSLFILCSANWATYCATLHGSLSKSPSLFPAISLLLGWNQLPSALSVGQRVSCLPLDPCVKRPE